MNNYKTHEVHAWAIMTDKTRIVSYIDPSIPDFDKVCNAYKEKGFYVVKLFGEIEIAEETVTINKAEMKKVLHDYGYTIEQIKYFLKRVGFTGWNE